MSEEVKGYVSGASRKEMIDKAQKRVAPFFDVATPCIRVEFGPIKTIGAEHFEADYTAIIWHDIESKAYGPSICRNCGRKDWPHDKVNR